MLGVSYIEITEVDQALELFQKADALYRDSKKIKCSGTHSHIVYHCARCLTEQGDYQNALAEFKRCFTVRKICGDTKGMLNTEHSMGVVYMNNGENKKALEILKESRDKAFALEDLCDMMSTSTNIALCLKQKNGLKKLSRKHTI